ncbi:MAG: molybdopterin synthase small subunit [Candidatus Bathyarchaeota archaeon BA1]|nr:MAG: molybdopterin synthase small subunit [Candidatus Bathyarchaeota archaeon BA1]
MFDLRVKVKAYATIRDAIGASVEVRLHEGASVKDLLNELTRSHGKSSSERVLDQSGGLLPYVKLLVNGRDIDLLNRLETKLKDGDEVALFPPVGGG